MSFVDKKSFIDISIEEVPGSPAQKGAARKARLERLGGK